MKVHIVKLLNLHFITDFMSPIDCFVPIDLRRLINGRRFLFFFLARGLLNVITLLDLFYLGRGINGFRALFFLAYRLLNACILLYFFYLSLRINHSLRHSRVHHMVTLLRLLLTCRTAPIKEIHHLIYY